MLKNNSLLKSYAIISFIYYRSEEERSWTVKGQPTLQADIYCMSKNFERVSVEISLHTCTHGLTVRAAFFHSYNGCATTTGMEVHQCSVHQFYAERINERPLF